MINSFRGRYYFLSTYYECKISIMGNIYPNAEAAFQAMCCQYSSDRLEYRHVTGSEARRMGRKSWKISDYDYRKDKIMYQVLKEKFKQNGYLRKRLLETYGEEIVYENTWKDYYWGVCNGYGENVLGKALMRVRDELMNRDWITHEY